MATVKLLSDDEHSHEARVVFYDIRKTRRSDFVNNFRRVLAHTTRKHLAEPDSTGDCVFPAKFRSQGKPSG